MLPIPFLRRKLVVLNLRSAVPRHNEISENHPSNRRRRVHRGQDRGKATARGIALLG